MLNDPIFAMAALLIIGIIANGLCEFLGRELHASRQRRRAIKRIANIYDNPTRRVT